MHPAPEGSVPKCKKNDNDKDIAAPAACESSNFMDACC